MGLTVHSEEHVLRSVPRVPAEATPALFTWERDKPKPRPANYFQVHPEMVMPRKHEIKLTVIYIHVYDLARKLSDLDNPELVERVFKGLANEWQKDTMPVSSVNAITEHPAYQAILNLGKKAIPLILQKLQFEVGHWFPALRELTGSNPVSPDHRGNMELMRQDWLQWGKDNRYI